MVLSHLCYSNWLILWSNVWYDRHEINCYHMLLSEVAWLIRRSEGGGSVFTSVMWTHYPWCNCTFWCEQTSWLVHWHFSENSYSFKSIYILQLFLLPAWTAIAKFCVCICTSLSILYDQSVWYLVWISTVTVLCSIRLITLISSSFDCHIVVILNDITQVYIYVWYFQFTVLVQILLDHLLQNVTGHTFLHTQCMWFVQCPPRIQFYTLSHHRVWISCKL